MDWFSTFFAERFKAFFAAAAVALIPALIKAFETTMNIDVPGAWESNIQQWFLALITGVVVNYTSNIKKA
jgi:hypothetical protein